MSNWWELSRNEQVGEAHLDDFFAEHLLILEGVSEILCDLFHNSSDGEGRSEIQLSLDTVLTLSRIMERALHDLRDRINLANGQIVILVARVAELEKGNDADVVGELTGRPASRGSARRPGDRADRAARREAAAPTPDAAPGPRPGVKPVAGGKANRAPSA